MHSAHPGGISGGQVIIDRYHVDSLAFQSVQISRKRGHQCLTFTCFHFSDTSLMQDNTADQLHPEGLHIQYSPGGLTYRGICLRKQIVQSFPIGKTLLIFLRLILQLFVGKFHHGRP